MARRMGVAALAVVLALVAAGGAGARCVVAADLARGVDFKREGAGSGMAVARDGGVFIDYRIGQSGWTDRRQTVMGVYETRAEMLTPPGKAGPLIGIMRQSFGGRPPEPVSGKGWSAKINRTMLALPGMAGLPMGNGTRRVNATYRFLPAMDVRISGCPYRVIPVEAQFVTRDAALAQRWLYFPSLGFAIETIAQGSQRRTGITSLKPTPMR